GTQAPFRLLHSRNDSGPLGHDTEGDRLSLLAGALCTNGAWAADGAALRIAARSSRYPYLSPRPLHADHRFALISVCRDQPVVPTIESPDGQIAWVLGDV